MKNSIITSVDRAILAARAAMYSGPTDAELRASRIRQARADIAMYAARGDVVMAAQARRTLIELGGK